MQVCGHARIGLLMLQARLNAGKGPALYLCPDNYLIAQTCDQAKQFGIATLRFQFDADVAASCKSGGEGAAGGVEDDLAGLRKSLDEGLEDTDGLLGRMAAVAGVDPGLHVGQRLDGKTRPALGQNVGLLVAVLEEARGGGVALVPDDVTDRREACGLPRLHEGVNGLTS